MAGRGVAGRGWARQGPARHGQVAARGLGEARQGFMKYPDARRSAFARSNGRCQFCGKRDAQEAHHWAWPRYPPTTTADDLTALCLRCHVLATALRRFQGDDAQLESRFMEAIAECFTQSKSLVSGRSSCTPAEVSTPSSLPTSRIAEIVEAQGLQPDCDFRRRASRRARMPALPLAHRGDRNAHGPVAGDPVVHRDRRTETCARGQTCGRG